MEQRTALDLWTAAGLPADMLDEHIAAGRMEADGQPVTSREQLIERPGTFGVGLDTTPDR